MKITRCDRCGKPIKEFHTIYTLTSDVWFMSSVALNNYDLCKDCVKDLEKYMKYKYEEKNK